MLKNISHFIAATALGLMLAACGKSDRNTAYTTMEGSVWHTTMHITYGSERDLSDNITAVTDCVELSLSPFISYSRISAINRNENMQVDDYITRVFDESVRINRLSGGAFDPTVAPLINLWGFGYENGDGEPDEAAIDSCLTLTGIDQCRIEDGVMVKKAPGTQFNFSAITKGFGIDCLAAMLRGEGIDNYMVEIGGEVAVSGVNPRGDKWRIQIDSPESDKTGHRNSTHSHDRRRSRHSTDGHGRRRRHSHDRITARRRRNARNSRRRLPHHPNHLHLPPHHTVEFFGSIIL